MSRLLEMGPTGMHKCIHALRALFLSLASCCAYRLRLEIPERYQHFGETGDAHDNGIVYLHRLGFRVVDRK